MFVMTFAERSSVSSDNKVEPITPQLKAETNGVDIVLDEEALVSLANFFDVLIQIDLEQQNNEGDINENGTDTTSDRVGGGRKEEDALGSDKARLGRSETKKSRNQK